MSEKDATFRILEIVRDLYSDHGIIMGFLTFLKRESSHVFRYLDDPLVDKTNNVPEHHFSVRSELLKNRFKTDDGLMRTSYWYHRQSTKI